MRLGFLITGLVLILAANILLLAGYGVARPTSEGFASYFLNEAGGAKDKYEAIGQFDGVKVSTGNSVSDWRYKMPDAKLRDGAPEFEPGPDNLFMFKNNIVSPECCGASYSASGGCICTTRQQRKYLSERAGNRGGIESGEVP